MSTSVSTATTSATLEMEGVPAAAIDYTHAISSAAYEGKVEDWTELSAWVTGIPIEIADVSGDDNIGHADWYYGCCFPNIELTTCVDAFLSLEFIFYSVGASVTIRGELCNSALSTIFSSSNLPTDKMFNPVANTLTAASKVHVCSSGPVEIDVTNIVKEILNYSATSPHWASGPTATMNFIFYMTPGSGAEGSATPSTLYWKQINPDAQVRLTINAEVPDITILSLSTTIIVPTLPLVITGVDFGAVTGLVELCNTADYATATVKVAQTVTAWADTEITCTMNRGTLPSLSAAWLFVTHDLGSRSDPYPVSITKIFGRVFYDGFESGNTNLWEQDDYHNRGQVVTTSTDGIAGPDSGTYMLRCNRNGTVASGTPEQFETLLLDVNSLYTNELFIRVRLRLDVNHIRTVNSPPKLLRFMSYGFNDEFTMYADAGTAGLGSGIHIGTKYSPGYYGNAPGDTTASTAAWHQVEYYIHTNGTCKIWNDNVLVDQLTGGNLQGRRWSELYLVSNTGDGHDAVNHLYFDNIEIFSDLGTGGFGSLAGGTASITP